MAECVVIDASALVDLLLANDVGRMVDARVRGHDLAAPAHLDAEILSAFARLERGGQLSESQVTQRIERLAQLPLDRHALAPLLQGAWRRHNYLRVLDALYVELAEQLDTVVVTTDLRLARAHQRASAVGNDT